MIEGGHPTLTVHIGQWIVGRYTFDDLEAKFGVKLNLSALSIMSDEWIERLREIIKIIHPKADGFYL